MLRITEQRTPDRLVLKLEGALWGDMVPELDALWQTARRAGASPSIWVDLSDVCRVDSAGWTLLTRMHRAGASFITRGCLMRELLREHVESEPCVT